MKKIQIDRLNYFKNELKSYRYLCSKRLALLDEKKVLDNQLYGYGGPNYDGVHIENSFHEVNPITLIEEKMRRNKALLETVVDRINNIDLFLSELDSDLKRDIMLIYIDKKCSVDQRATLHNLTVMQERRNIDNTINMFLENNPKI